MPTYVSLIRFTEQGAKNIRDTQKRVAGFRESAAAAGVTVREVFWTLGTYDGLLLLDAPDEETVTALMVGLDALGNVHTQTMRAFDESEIGNIIERSAGAGRTAGRAAGRSNGGTSEGAASRRTASATHAGRGR